MKAADIRDLADAIESGLRVKVGPGGNMTLSAEQRRKAWVRATEAVVGRAESTNLLLRAAAFAVVAGTLCGVVAFGAWFVRSGEAESASPAAVIEAVPGSARVESPWIWGEAL